MIMRKRVTHAAAMSLAMLLRGLSLRGPRCQTAREMRSPNEHQRRISAANVKRLVRNARNVKHDDARRNGAIRQAVRFAVA